MSSQPFALRIAAVVVLSAAMGEPPSPQDDVYSLAAILFWLLTGMYANGSSAPVAGERLSGATPAPPR
ncbi:MAG TPA: hypothetical protein PLV92_20125, partial [Pirellulaceae bacterium]|nr:hypothetical protein [Pirellulaceae bacterium]